MATVLPRHERLRQYSMYFLHLRAKGEIWVVRTYNIPTGPRDGVPLGVSAVGGPLDTHQAQAIRRNHLDWSERRDADLDWFWQQMADGAPTEFIDIGFE